MVGKKNGGDDDKKKDKPPPKKTPRPINVPKLKPTGAQGNCPACGVPKGQHTIKQLMDCLATLQ